jgi:hypothetical protein
LNDYYSILGLDPGASPESIKVAYRCLARATHPDFKVNASEKDKTVYSLQMAALNEAYGVLSDTKRRREYDEKMRLQVILASKTTAAATATATATRPETASRTTAHRVVVRPRYEVDPTVVKEFSNHFRASFLNDRESFAWKPREAEGFDWALEALFWSSHYCVAARGSSVVDPATLRKLINYSEILVARSNRSIRKSYFLFLFPFQQMTDWDTVSAQCQRFTTGESHRKNSVTGIVLLDMQHGRTLRFGTHVKEKRFAELLQRVETPA